MRKHTTKHKISDTCSVIVWDNGGKTLDRYTAVFYGKGWEFKRAGDCRIYHQYLGLSKGGIGFSCFGEIYLPCSNLGRRVKWDELLEPTRDHILNRVKGVR